MDEGPFWPHPGLFKELGKSPVQIGLMGPLFRVKLSSTERYPPFKCHGTCERITVKKIRIVRTFNAFEFRVGQQ